MVSHLLITALIFLNNLPVPVEIHHFQIIHKDKIVGQLTVKKSHNGDLTIYRSSTNLSIRLPLSVKVLYDMHVEFKDGILYKSETAIFINDKLKTKAQTKRIGGSYYFYKNEKLKKTFEGDIFHSTVLLYFGQPAGIQKTYSEENGHFTDISQIVPGTYEKTNTNGNKNIYQYNDDFLKYLNIQTSIINFKLSQIW